MYVDAGKDASFDLHLATDTLPSDAEDALRELGFVRDAFRGGTAGVVRPFHFSVRPRPQSREEVHMRWERVTQALGSGLGRLLSGYMEAEETQGHYRTRFEWRPFNPSVGVPLKRLHHQTCLPPDHKAFDFHLSVSLKSLDTRLQAIFEDWIQFYYIDVGRNDDERRRVYTFQTVGPVDVASAFAQLHRYCARVGGFEGHLKLERTVAYARFPFDASVPPVVADIAFVEAQA